MSEIRIHVEEVEYLKSTVAKINKRAAKQGFDSIAYVIEEDTEPHFRVVTFSAESVGVDGFIPVAIGEYQLNTAVWSAFPGEEIPESHLKDEQHCDLCNIKRHRGKTYLFRNEETGEHTMYGTKCAKDFFGYNPTVMLRRALKLADLFADIDEDGFFGGRGKSVFSLQIFLATTFQMIDAEGWAPRSRAEEGYATVDKVLAVLSDSSHWKSFRQSDMKADQAVELADAAVARVNAIENPANSYMHNLTVIAEAGYVTVKTAGFAASIANYHERETAKEIEQEERANAAGASEYQGTVGTRLKNINCKVEFVRHFNGYYGVTAMTKMRDTDGNVYVWWASGDAPIQDDGAIVLAGTVKEHNMYNNEKQTILNRCRWELAEKVAA